MGRSLPESPNIEQLRKQAKDLVKSYRRRDASACPILRRLSRFARASDEEILNATLTLAEAQHALAGEYGFKNWAALVRFVKEMGHVPAGYRAVHMQWDQFLKGEGPRHAIQLHALQPAQSGPWDRFPKGNRADIPPAAPCDLCKEPATVHFTEKIEGKLRTQHFCADHAAQCIPRQF